MVDITQSKLTTQRCNAIVASAMDAVFMIGRDGVIRECNDEMARLTGYGMDELPGLPVSALELIDSPNDIAEHMARIAHEGTDRFESRWRRKSGEPVDVEITATYLSLNEEFCPFTRDITFIRSHQREIERVTHYDTLTGVPNRSLLTDRMQLALSQTRRNHTQLAVCYLDLKNVLADRLLSARSQDTLTDIPTAIDRLHTLSMAMITDIRALLANT